MILRVTFCKCTGKFPTRLGSGTGKFSREWRTPHSEFWFGKAHIRKCEKMCNRLCCQTYRKKENISLVSGKAALFATDRNGPICPERSLFLLTVLPDRRCFTIYTTISFSSELGALGLRLVEDSMHMRLHMHLCRARRPRHSERIGNSGFGTLSRCRTRYGHPKNVKVPNRCRSIKSLDHDEAQLTIVS